MPIVTLAASAIRAPDPAATSPAAVPFRNRRRDNVRCFIIWLSHGSSMARLVLRQSRGEQGACHSLRPQPRPIRRPMAWRSQAVLTGDAHPTGAPMAEIPVIDIGPLVARSGGAADVAAAIGAACRETGFFYVVGH